VSSSAVPPPPAPVNKGAIAGGVVGGVIVLALLAGGLIYYNRCRKQEQPSSGDHHEFMVNNEPETRYHDIPKVPEMSSGPVMPTGLINSGGNAPSNVQGRLSGNPKDDELQYVL